MKCQHDTLEPIGDVEEFLGELAQSLLVQGQLDDASAGFAARVDGLQLHDLLALPVENLESDGFHPAISAKGLGSVVSVRNMRVLYSLQRGRMVVHGLPSKKR